MNFINGNIEILIYKGGDTMKQMTTFNNVQKKKLNLLKYVGFAILDLLTNFFS